MRKDASQNKFRWEPPTKNSGESENLDNSASVLEPSSVVVPPAPAEPSAVGEEQKNDSDGVEKIGNERAELAPKNPASASVTSLARMIRNEIPIVDPNDSKRSEEETSQDKAAEIAPEELAKLRELVSTESDGDKNLSAALMARKLDRAFKKEDGEGSESDVAAEGDERIFDSSRAPQAENVLKKSSGEQLHAFFLRHPAVSASLCLVAILVPFGIFGIGHSSKEVKKSAAEDTAKLPTPANMTAKQLIAHSKASYAKKNKLTALNDLFAAAKLSPKDASVYLARGDFYYNEKKLASAADDYKMALQLNPRIERAQKQLALCRSSLAAGALVNTKPDKAPVISKAVRDEIAATDFDALRVKAFSALQAGKFDYAVVALSRCAQLRPNDALTRRYLAFALLSNGELSLAIEQFHAWSRVDSASLSDKLKFGRALAAAEGLEGSETTRQFFNTLVNDHSTEPDALLRIATTCYDLGFYDEPTSKAIQIALRTASNETSEKLEALQNKVKEKQNAATQESAFKPLIKG